MCVTWKIIHKQDKCVSLQQHTSGFSVELLPPSGDGAAVLFCSGSVAASVSVQLIFIIYVTQ